jgi:uncharacterized Zn finger protein (UPF0148 family)
MRLELKKLHLVLRRSKEVINLPRIIYFYGPIGSGKSSIGRLIDYCLGGKSKWTPALQAELVSVALELAVNGTALTLHRDRDAARIVATWRASDETLQVVIPATDAAEEVLPDARVKVLSDLLFHLAKEEAPYVRRRKGTPEEHLERLSFRDLFRFCYLDQDGMDNIFFRLDSENYATLQKSVDAIRYVLGYRTEQVAELESQLQAIREERLGLIAGAKALENAFVESGLDDLVDYDAKIERIRAETDRARMAAQAARTARGSVPHAVEEVREQARRLAMEKMALEQAGSEIDTRRGELERHVNELQMLSVRFQRTAAARMLLGGVAFSSCPRCTQTLPDRGPQYCSVCGQPEHIVEADGALSEQVVKEDLQARRSELKDSIERLERQHIVIGRRSEEISSELTSANHALQARLLEYDSAFLSQALQHERQVVTLEQKLNGLLRNRKLPDVLKMQRERAELLQANESGLRRTIEAAKRLAFNDRANIDLLGRLFLDCLVRAKFPDVRETYPVEINPGDFYPRIPLGNYDALVTLAYDNAGSGGMKALFKTCFALALHRVCARMSDSRLPPLLIIDTPTKNVSSVENPGLIASFFRLVYELAAGELAHVQIVIIDNEFNSVPSNIELQLASRHLVRGDATNPPLIPYLDGDFSSLPLNENTGEIEEED